MQHSYAASATGPAAPPQDAGAGNQWRGINLKVVSPAEDCVVSVVVSQNDAGYVEVARVTGPNWCTAQSDLTARYVNAFVVSLGTGGKPLSAIVTAAGT